MRRHSRMVITERVIPFLAALVGLLALAGAVLVELDVEQRTARVTEDLARMRLSLEVVLQRADSLAGAMDDGTAEGLLALQERMDRLEAVWEQQPGPVVASTDPAGSAQADPSAAAQVDPNLPTEDCIPPGTRFMGVTGDSYAICQTPAVVRVSAITGDSVVIDGAGVVTEATSAALAGTTCTLTVFSADVEGFAEMRVSCQ